MIVLLLLGALVCTIALAIGLAVMLVFLWQIGYGLLYVIKFFSVGRARSWHEFWTIFWLILWESPLAVMHYKTGSYVTRPFDKHR